MDCHSQECIAKSAAMKTGVKVPTKGISVSKGWMKSVPAWILKPILKGV